MEEVQSYWHDFGSTGVSFSLSGRIRLFDLWFSSGRFGEEGKYAEFRNSDVSGDILFKITNNLNLWGAGTNIILPKGGILFPEGLYVGTDNDATYSTQSFTTMTLLYQMGGI